MPKITKQLDKLIKQAKNLTDEEYLAFVEATHRKIPKYPATPGRFYVNEIEDRDVGTPWTWGKDDERQADWAKERANFGFDEREMWNGYNTILILIYERLRWWQDYKPPMDYSHLTFIIDNTKQDYDYSLRYLIETLRLHITLDNMDAQRKTIHKQRIETWQDLFVEIAPTIGW